MKENTVNQTEIQRAAAQKRAEEQYKGTEINGYLCLAATDKRIKGDGIVWLVQCDKCGEVFETTLKQIRKGKKCLCCSNSAKQRREEYAKHIGEVFGRLTFLEITESTEKHLHGKFRCACDGREVNLRLESVFNGKTKSCGCLQREMGRKKLETAVKKNVAMGTNLPIISRTDWKPTRNNKSGYTGIWEDKVRGNYLVRLYFQNQCYVTRCGSMSEAIHARDAMKQIHNTFVDWWKKLSSEERLHASAAYSGEHDASWQMLKKRLDAYFDEKRSHQNDNNNPTAFQI